MRNSPLLKKDVIDGYTMITLIEGGPSYLTEIYSPTHERIFYQSIPWSLDDSPEEQEEMKNYILSFHHKVSRVIQFVVNQDWIDELQSIKIEDSWRYEKINMLIKQLHELTKITEKALHLCAVLDDNDSAQRLDIAFDHLYDGIVILKKLFGINLMEKE